MRRCPKCGKDFDAEYVANHVHGIDGLDEGTKVFLTTAIVAVKPGAGTVSQEYLHFCGECLRVELLALAGRITREEMSCDGV